MVGKRKSGVPPPARVRRKPAKPSRRRGQALTAAPKTRHRPLSPVRCPVAHPCLVCKRLLGGRKVRYRGWTQNTPCAYVFCGLTHVYLVKDTRAAYGDVP